MGDGRKDLSEQPPPDEVEVETDGAEPVTRRSTRAQLIAGAAVTVVFLVAAWLVVLSRFT